MNKIITLSLVILVQCSATKENEASTRPKLIIGIVVDQMRQEYLYRFADGFQQGGFRRLVEGGHSFDNTHYNYIPTATGPGHASIYTGTTPSFHGIIDNNWFDRYGKNNMYCVSDTRVSTVGSTNENVGKVSPKNLISTTITDEIGLFFQSKSKILSLSVKDRSAILSGGHQPTGSYWYDGSSGNFVTSTFYMEKLPLWLTKFNQLQLAHKYNALDWNTLYPLEYYTASGSDNQINEKLNHGEAEPIFPHKNNSESSDYWNVIHTPYGNTLLTEAAIAAIDGESMGQDEIMDFLALSYSSTDIIGHGYGPNSVEIQDTYLRLDQELKQLFDYLDQKVGKHQWMVFLTADHAVGNIPAQLQSLHHEAGYLNKIELSGQLNQQLFDQFGTDNLVLKCSGNQIYLDRDLIKNEKLHISRIKQSICDELNTKAGIVGAYDIDKLQNFGSEPTHVNMLAAAFSPKRSGDVMFITQSGWLSNSYEHAGTSHMTLYSYDTHVPLVFYGRGIDHDRTVRRTNITDIIPTLSAMLKLPLPSAATGEPLEELFD